MTKLAGVAGQKVLYYYSDVEDDNNDDDDNDDDDDDDDDDDCGDGDRASVCRSRGAEDATLLSVW